LPSCHSGLWHAMQCNEMKLILKSGKMKRLVGLKVHVDGFKPAKFLEWWSAVASVRYMLMLTFGLIERKT
jgi:hypothetical protein